MLISVSPEDTNALYMLFFKNCNSTVPSVNVISRALVAGGTFKLEKLSFDVNDEDILTRYPANSSVRSPILSYMGIEN